MPNELHGKLFCSLQEDHVLEFLILTESEREIFFQKLQNECSRILSEYYGNHMEEFRLICEHEKSLCYPCTGKTQTFEF